MKEPVKAVCTMSSMMPGDCVPELVPPLMRQATGEGFSELTRRIPELENGEFAARESSSSWLIGHAAEGCLQYGVEVEARCVGGARVAE
jgi:hypothetical protein